MKVILKGNDKNMETVLISACLVGDKVRYDGKGKYDPRVKEILEKYKLLPYCPEVMGGLSTPRDKSEILTYLDELKVVSEKGKDVTKNYLEGAKKSLSPISYMHVKKAILQEKSPACGVHLIHNGEFNDKLVPGEGVLTRYLKEHSIEVYTIDEFYDQFIKENK